MSDQKKSEDTLCRDSCACERLRRERQWQATTAWNFMNLQSVLNMLSHIVSSSVFLLRHWCDTNVHTKGRRLESNRPAPATYCFTMSETVSKHFQIVKYLQKISVFTSHNWGQCMISNVTILLLFSHVHTPPRWNWPKCTFWCSAAAKSRT